MANFLNIFVHRGGFARAVRHNTADLAALGIVDPSIWIDLDGESQNGDAVFVGTPQGGVDDSSTINAMLNEVGNLPIHMVVLNVVESDGLVTTQEAAGVRDRLLRVGLPSMQDAVDTNLVISRIGAPLDSALPTIAGWQNLLLAPEDGDGPDITSAAQIFSESAMRGDKFELFVANSVATLFGLWKGTAKLPVAGAAGADQSVRLVRGFFRHIDGQQIQQSLRDGIFDVTQTPQVTTGDGVGTRHVLNQKANNDEAVQEIFGHHQDAFTVAVTDGQVSKTKSIDANAALKSFAAFYFKNIVSWPSVFFSTVTSSVQDKVNQVVQKNLYGEDSEFYVGRLDAQPVDGVVDSSLPSYQVEVGAFEQLWRDYIYTSLAMVDGQARFENSEAEKDRKRKYLEEPSEHSILLAQTPEDVIPGPSTAMGRDRLPHAIGSQVPDEQVPPYDVKKISQFERALKNNRSRGVSNALQTFHNWKTKYEGSFARRFAEKFVEKQHELEAQREAAQRQLDQLRNGYDTRITTSGAASVFCWLGWVAFWSMAVFAAAWGIGNAIAERPSELWDWVRNLNAAETKTKIIMFVVWFLVWLIFFLVQVYLESKRIYQLAYRKVEYLSKQEAARQRLAQADATLRHMAVGYDQFLSLSKVFGSVLERPFGTVQHASQESSVPTSTMPRAVSISWAEPENAAIREVIDSSRRKIFSQGWLSGCLSQIIGEAVREVKGGSTEQGPRDSQKNWINELINSKGEGSGQLLDRVAHHVSFTDFLSHDRSQNAWSEIVAQLSQDNHAGQSALLNHQMIYENGTTKVKRKLATLGDARDQGVFNGEFVTSTGRSDAEAHHIDQTHTSYQTLNVGSDQVGFSELLVQFGKAAGPSSFEFNKVDKSVPKPAGSAVWDSNSNDPSDPFGLDD